METSDHNAVAFGRSQLAKSLLATAFVTIVITAGALKILEMRRIAAGLRSIASIHAAEARTAERTLNKIDAGSLPEADHPALREWLARSILYHKQKEQRYLNAAAKPWSQMPIDRDLPPSLPAEVFQGTEGLNQASSE